MGKRGDLLGTLCEGHTEPGMKAGYVWCTDAANRRRMRDHLLSLPEPEHTHVELIHGCAQCEAIRKRVPVPSSMQSDTRA
jgi:hypothetical protein